MPYAFAIPAAVGSIDWLDAGIAVSVVGSVVMVGRWWITNVSAKNAEHQRTQDGLDREANRKNQKLVTDTLVGHVELTGKAIQTTSIAVQAIVPAIGSLRELAEETHEIVKKMRPCNGRHDDPSQPPNAKRQT